jgi:acyl-coenzyme A synthetase/AMP-(fatty) acid ligase
MQGYWGDPDKTAARLVRDPLGEGDDRPYYRTGDIVVEDADGNYRFLGRRDAQVKTRGYRVELGEIETALNSHPGVRECAAVAVPDPLVTNRLHAFVVVDPGVGIDELTRRCADRLPPYMIPERITVLDQLPRTSTDKIDRRALADGG